MNETEARTLREAHNAYVKRLSRRTLPALHGDYRNEMAAAGQVVIYGGPLTRDELISALCELRYPAAKLNEAAHVLWHSYGAVNSACRLCHGTGSHNDLNCDCGLISLHTECGACGHPRHKHWRPSGDCANDDGLCPCPGYVTGPRPAPITPAEGDSRELPWLGDIDRRADDDVEFCVEDDEP